MHAPVAKAFLKAGIHVICDKPLTTTLKEAQSLQKAAAASKCIFAVTYNYTGYPMVRHARAMIEAWRAARAESRSSRRPKLLRVAITSTMPVGAVMSWL